jgi:hypothetical protein
MAEDNAWNLVLNAALKMPGAKVNRDDFLRTTFAKYYSDETIEKAIATRPALAGIPASAITTFAKSSIAWHRSGVSAISLMTGLPGGWWIAGTVPADLTQFFWHVIVILQKLAYLYGWPDFFDKEKREELDDETLHLMTVFVGVMLGAEAASRMLDKIAENLGKEIIKRLPRMALSKLGFYQVAKEVAKWIGVKITKTSFARILSKVVPIVSGLISGGMSWWSFSVMSKKLRLHLEGMQFSKST